MEPTTKGEANRLRVSSGSNWEGAAGYSRAIRAGNIVEVAGTTAMQDGKVVGANDAAAQTRCILNKIKEALNEAGGKLEDVVRTRMYVVDITQWEAIGKVHGEFFGDIRPASTMVEVKALIMPELLVEIEATAVVDP